MSRAYWDSMVFIYLLEGNAVFGERVRRMHEQMLRRGDRLTTSVFTIGEVLTGPRRRGDLAAVRAIQGFFSSDEVELLPMGAAVADRYSLIRASMHVSQPDAIHLATAAEAQVDLFVTNDAQVQKLKVPGIRFMLDLDGRIC